MKPSTSPKTNPKDFFLHLLGAVALYTSVIAYAALLFQYINIYFPDPLNDHVGLFARQSLRWPLSVLIVVFPLYIWLMHYLQRDLVTHPEKRKIRTRKWLLYFTLFASAIAIIIDLIALIFYFLGGELTTPFILKVVAVLFIAASVLIYYIWMLKKPMPALAHPTMRLFVFAVVGITSFAILAGFFVAGSPQSERLRRFDELRISQLQGIQYEIASYWQAKNALPQSLDDLRNEITGFIPPIDPETGKSYEYSIIDKTSFELCATFKTSNRQNVSPESQPIPALPYGFEENFLHDEGRACFTRTIDPDRFPPLKPRPVFD